MSTFTHLHVHTEYSVLDGASNIEQMLARAKEMGMNTLAITDHGNMFGAKVFHKNAGKAGIKPVIGCEVYVAKGSRTNRDDKNDRGYHLILLAKNSTGYMNLVKLVSYSWTEGFYYNPRVDRDLIKEYSEGIIASSACLGGEIASSILNNDMARAREVIAWYKSVFGEDYYLEVIRHPSGVRVIDEEVYRRQELVCEGVKKLSGETGTKIIATNDIHFVSEEEADAHDRLICINTGKDVDDPDRLRYTRQEYLKSPEQMAELFSDIPEAIATTMEIAEKIEIYPLDHEPIMPDFPLPPEFSDENEYLKHLTYEGAKFRYGTVSDEIRERIDFELKTIKGMGYPGYFLIVQDFIRAARDMDVSVGPGRGSAAGSAVAYCLRITDIDPIRYNLLFERFLNPDRISLPDIDIDFDEDGRDLVLKWVVEKYGHDKVAQIITFGRMQPKMAIRDVARVQKLPLQEADRVAKLVPERPGTDFKRAYEEVPELKELRNNGNAEIATVLELAEKLEGTVRNTGIHACGVIISRDKLEDHIPICKFKDSDLFITQYEGKHIEDVGMLKMDFLGLKTLSIIKDALENIQLSNAINIDITAIPLDDEKTYELYSKGETTGLFQFESPGMKKHLKVLKPNRFEDLIAMNALYRPGPMDYIPSFINRKHGREKIEYDLPEVEEFLHDTYGITVYQEQVMLLSQKLAGFSKGQADSLRKAMGKKIRSMMDEMKEKFLKGCTDNGHSVEKAEKIWSDWEAFAEYAFNKSHSTCYAYISYQTAYLKAHYPAEFMAAVLSRNLSDIKKIGFFMDECRRMGIRVLGPDVNESRLKFTVNKKGQIRFGLGAIKGVGEAAVEQIVKERESNGHFTDVWNFVERVNLQAANKKTLEALALAGAFDSFDAVKRHQYMAPDETGATFIENLIRYGNKVQSEKSTPQQSLFGDKMIVAVTKPAAIDAEEWSNLETLDREKEVVGMYISAHPLDEFRTDMDYLCTHTLADLADLKELNGKDVTVSGIVTSVQEKTTKTGNPYGTLMLEDYSGTYRQTFFSKDFVKFKNFFTPGYSIMLRGKVRMNDWKKETPEPEFYVDEIDMLSEARKKIKSLIIKTDILLINGEFISNFEELAKKHKGNTMLKFLVYDPQDSIWVEMFSRSNSVYLSNDFIDYLQNNSDIEFKLE
ncbi:MAG: DNA polymerase III subunit alpha [Bacteroidota bacterium]